MRRFVRQAPLTVGYTVLALLLGVLTGSLPNGPGPAVLDAVGTGVGGHWWSPVAAIPLWGGLAGHLVTAALVLGAGLVAERRIGALRTAALLVGTQVVGTLLTLGAVTAGSAAGGAWAGELATQLAVGGAPGAVGLLLAVSHVLSALWRRRIRLVLLVGVVMLVAYSAS